MTEAGHPTDAEVLRACQIVERWVRRRWPPSKYRNLEDIAQDAVVGALKSRESYDPTKGASFVTYAFRGGQMAAWRSWNKHLAAAWGCTHNEVARGEGRYRMTELDRPAAQSDGDFTTHEVVADPDASAEGKLDETGACEAYDDACLRLAAGSSTAQLRNAAMLLRNTDMPVRTIAQRVGLSHERVAQVRRRAIQMARDELGVTEPVKGSMVPEPARGMPRGRCQWKTRKGRCHNLAVDHEHTYCVSHEMRANVRRLKEEKRA